MVVFLLELHMWVVSLVDHPPLCFLPSFSCRVGVSTTQSLRRGSKICGIICIASHDYAHEGLRIQPRSPVASQSHKGHRSNVDMVNAGHPHLMMETHLCILLVVQIHCWDASVVLRDLLLCVLYNFVYMEKHVYSICTYQVDLCLQFGPH